jgi:peptide/nickel transport system permease protein
MSTASELTADPAGPGGAAEAEAGPAPGKRVGLWRSALRLPRTWIGIVLTVLVLLIAFVGPYLAPHGADAFVGEPYATSAAHTAFGTDNLGRDVLSRFLEGGRELLLLSIGATVLGVGGGVLIGVLAGYRGGWLDEALMRVSDVVLAFPQVVLALLFLSIIGPKWWLIVLLVALGHAPRTGRVIRSAVLGVRERDFVRAAEASAVPGWRIMLSEILPNTTGSLMVEAGLRLTYSVGLVAGLGFLGLGIQPPAADWGLMINENRVALTVQPWAVVLPVVAIAVLTIGTNFITDGLARAGAGIDRGVDA